MPKKVKRRGAPRTPAVAVSRQRSIKAAAIVGGTLLGAFVAIKAFGGNSTGTKASAGGARPAPAPKVGKAAAPLLQQGQRNSPKVKMLQQALVKLGGEPARLIQAGGGADGTYGPAVVSALRASGSKTPTALSSVAYQAILTKASAAPATVAPTRKVAPSGPSAVAPARQPAAGAQGKPSTLPAPGLPLRVADIKQLRQSLIHAVTGGDLAKLVSVLKYFRTGADWDQVVHGKDYQPWKDKLGRNLDTNIVNQFGVKNPYILAQFQRLGLAYDEYQKAFVKR